MKSTAGPGITSRTIDAAMNTARVESEGTGRQYASASTIYGVISSASEAEDRSGLAGCVRTRLPGGCQARHVGDRFVETSHELLA